jgi:rubrerythrin
MRESPLGRDPEVHPVTLAVLVGIARSIERESVQRYEILAATMQRRGDAATAAAFRLMLEEERKHVDAVEHWAESLGVPASEAPFEWRLPADLSGSWDEIAGSARVTPYRAFAIAVDNEQRAFTLYSYLAAAAEDPHVVAQAERLALEELRHAALMRQWRRRAWHRERRVQPEQRPDVSSPDELRAWLDGREAAIASRHRELAARLRALGDEESALLLERLDAAPPRAPDAAAGHDDAALQAVDPVHLLVAAQEPLEALSEGLEALMRASEGALFEAAELALAGIVARLARISMQVGRRMQTV